MDVNNLLEGASPYKVLSEQSAKLAGKWEKSGLLEGITSSTERSNMSMLLENQAKQLVTETSQTGGGTANFTAGTGDQWAGVALPLVRKVFGQIAAKEFVSVQPMNLPSGLVFYLDFQYGTSKAPFSAGDSMYGTPSPTNPATNTSGFGNTNTGGLYGAGRYSYSTQLTGALVTMAQTSASWDDANYDGNFASSSTVILSGSGLPGGTSTTYKLLSVATSSLPNLDVTAIRSFTLFSASVNVNNYPAFTKVVGPNLQFFVATADAVAPIAAITDCQISYSLATQDNLRGDFEDQNNALNNNNSPIDIPQVNVQMSSEAIVAKTKKLKAVWTPEFAQDLNAYHSLDAEAELTSIMSEYISLEIDLEILDMLMTSANAGTETWSARNNDSIAQDATGTTTSLGFYNSQGQWFQTLGTKIQKLSNIIHQKTLRGGASFLVCSPTVGTVLESIPGFASTSDGDAAKGNYAFGVQKVGSLNGRYQVYKNPYMTENQILLGYRGTQFLEAGAVFAPYIPLIMTPMVYDPNTFTPRKGLLTRYAKKMLRPEYYGIIKVAGLETL